MGNSAARTAVERGAALLDRVLPGWYKIGGPIDLASLEIRSFGYCILGQCFGSYVFGVEFLAIEGQERMLGFNQSIDAGYLELNQAWHDLIVARRVADAPERPEPEPVPDPEPKKQLVLAN